MTGVRGPFAVVIDDGSGARHVTRKIDLQGWSKVARGGNEDISFRLHDRVDAWDLGPDSTISVYDTRTSLPVWSGWATMPGKTQGVSGEFLDVQGFCRQRLEDVSSPLIYVSRDMTHFQRAASSTKGAETTSGEINENTPTVEVSAPQGQTVSTFWQGWFVDRRFYRAGLTLGWARASASSGVNSAGYIQRLVTAAGGSGTTTTRDSRSASVTPALLFAERGGTHNIPAGEDVVYLGVTRESTETVGADSHWFRFSGYVARQVLKDINGTDLSGIYAINSIKAHEVIADLVGRGMMPGVDPALVSIPTTTYAIDNLDFIEGATAAAVLDTLLTFEPDLFWRYTGPAEQAFTAGLFDESNPRYVLSPSHGGIAQPGEDAPTNCTRVQVNWTDERGDERTTWVGTLGRDAQPVSLPAGLGSAANATQYGTAILAAASKPPRAGSAVLRKPVQDLWAGCFVQPWEVEPGHCVIEQTSGEVYRLMRADWDAPNGAASVEFGEPRRSPEQVLAAIDKKLRRKGRR